MSFRLHLGNTQPILHLDVTIQFGDLIKEICGSSGNRDEGMRGSSNVSGKELDQLSGYLVPRLVSTRYQLYEITLHVSSCVCKLK